MPCQHSVGKIMSTLAENCGVRVGDTQGAPTSLSRSGLMGVGLFGGQSVWGISWIYKGVNKIKLKYK